MLRLIIVAIFVVLFLTVSLPVQLVLWLLSKKWPSLPDHVSYPMVGWCFRVILFLSGVRLTVIGEDRIPRDTPVVYIGNHRSFFDVVTTYTRVIRPTGYLAKIELKKVPSLNFWMMLMHCIFLDRSDIKQGLKCILDCIDLLKKGISVTIFPEGTRNKEEGTFLPFHDASFKVALKSGCPIVPMVINHAGQVFEDHLPFIRATHVIIEYMDPIYPADISPEDKKRIGEYVSGIMKPVFDKNQSL